MRKQLWFGLIMGGAVALGIAHTGMADNDEGEGRWRLRGGEYQERGEPGSRLAAVKNTAYKNECGACHMAYLPGLLSADAWQNVMANLTNHFGDNAELAPDTARKITDYLVQHASAGRNASQHAASVPDMQPPRITQTRWFRREHNEIPRRMVKDNPEVKSFSNCAACHANAQDGSFRERDIRIPGYRQWGD